MRFNASRLIAVLAFFSLVAPAVFFAALGWQTYQRYLSSARMQLMQTLDVVREHASSVFETHELIAAKVELIMRGMSDEEIRANEANINVQLKDIVDRRPQVQDIWVLDRNGRPLVTGNVYPVPRDLDLSDRNYYRVFRDGVLKPDQLYISQVLRGRVQDVIFFQVAKPRAPMANGQFNGVDVVSVEPRHFERFFNELTRTNVDTISMIREDGSLLARSPPVEGSLADAPLATTVVEAVKRAAILGTYEAKSPLDGVERIVAYQKLPGLPVYLTAAVARSNVVAAWRAEFLQRMYFAIPATLALFALCLVALAYTRREAAALVQLQSESERRISAEGQLRQAQKMEAVGRLTGGVAHDFNNLLTIVLGNLDLLKRRLGDADDRVMKAIENARTGATRAASLTQRLLAFSRQQPLAPDAVDVNKLVAGMSDLLRRTLGETVAVETVLAGGLWRAHVDANQLESALLNLAVNARDAMPDGGKLTIETANAYLDDNYAAAHEDVQPGQYVMLAVADTGAGMTPEVAARAFEPFFTTKPVGQGTGLGLSQVYGFVKQSNGHVAIYSELNHGTAVKLYLPKLLKTDEQGGIEPVSAEIEAPRMGQGTILVVEDDEMVRQLSIDALEDAGYTVIHSEDARRGLGLLGAHPEIQMLFTDVVLTGGMNGRQLADEAIKMRPGLKVLFTTGYTQNAIVHQGRLDEGINFLGKPFTAAALIAKVQSVLKS